MSLAILQEKLQVADSGGDWNAATENALRSFQSANHLPATGEPDPGTFVTLGLYKPSQKRSSPTWRDIVSAMNQVPRWAWFGVGGLSFGLAYWSYRKRHPKAPGSTKKKR